jgi:formate dehydrogenase subunit gamma
MPSWDEGAARSLLQPYRNADGALLPALHTLVATFGYVDDRAIPLVAEVLNLSRAEVAGVVSFYTDFRRSPPGRHVVKVCRAEACQAVGAEAFVARLEERLAMAMDTTSPDGAVTLETVYCLGNCALGPAVLIDGRLYGRATAETVGERIAS